MSLFLLPYRRHLFFPNSQSKPTCRSRAAPDFFRWGTKSSFLLRYRRHLVFPNRRSLPLMWLREELTPGLQRF